MNHRLVTLTYTLIIFYVINKYNVYLRITGVDTYFIGAHGAPYNLTPHVTFETTQQPKKSPTEQQTKQNVSMIGIRQINC